jgi:hypothetical protein
MFPPALSATTQQTKMKMAAKTYLMAWQDVNSGQAWQWT